MAFWIVILTALGAGVMSAVAVHFLGRRHILAAMEQKGLHLKCSVCDLTVARYKQLEDHTIHCVNCLRAAERKAQRG